MLLRSSQKLSDEGGEAEDDGVEREMLPSEIPHPGQSRAPGERWSAHVKICAHASPRMGLSSSAITVVEDGSIVSIADEVSDDPKADLGRNTVDTGEEVQAFSPQHDGGGESKSIASRMVLPSAHTGSGTARRLTSSARASSLRSWH